MNENMITSLMSKLQRQQVVEGSCMKEESLALVGRRLLMILHKNNLCLLCKLELQRFFQGKMDKLLALSSLARLSVR